MTQPTVALISFCATTRAAAVSLIGVLFAIHLARRGLTPAAIGLVIGAGVAGSAAGMVVTGLAADRWGRRRTLLAIGVISGAGYAMVAFADRTLTLAAVAMLCMVNAMGRDRGPASALEQAIVPALTTPEQRTWALAWYNAAVDTGHAVGALGAMVPTALVAALLVDDGRARELTFAACGMVVALASVSYLFLDARVEMAERADAPGGTAVDPATRRVVRRIATLFAVDSIGGGFLSSALIAYWFFEQYGTSEVALAGLFFAARVLNVLSHLGAAWLARRIGLLNTMVFTHLPSSIFLMLAPLAPDATLAAVLFLLREALVEMDVPTRQSYVMAVVPDSARTFASSMTNLARNAGWAVGPLIGGPVMQVALAAPLVIGGTLKIGYDIALYRSFRHVRPPEEAV
jgi:MFS family permease